jgi:hypothetical protein
MCVFVPRLCSSAFSNDTIVIKPGMFGVDKLQRLVVVNQRVDEINQQNLSKADLQSFTKRSSPTPARVVFVPLRSEKRWEVSIGGAQKN